MPTNACCCGGGTPITNPCDVSCCQHFQVAMIKPEAGFTTTGDYLNFSATATASVVLTNSYANCDGIPSPSFYIARDGGKWDLNYAPFGSTTQIFDTVSTVVGCPPPGPGNWEFVSSTDGDGIPYVLTRMNCCDSVDPTSPPALILVTGWEQTQPQASATYASGTGSTYTLWDGQLTYDAGPNAWVPGGSGIVWRSMLCPDGRYFDFQPYFQWLSAGFEGSVVFQGTSATLFLWGGQSVCAPWYGELWFTQTDSTMLPIVKKFLTIGEP